jgi:uncharacterized RDD family membrane protein YckC
MPSNPSPADASSDSVVDKLTIETPEQTPLVFTIAGVGSRFLALALDTLIQIAFGIALGIGGAFAIRALAAFGQTATLWGAAVLVFLFFLLYFGYYAFFEITWNGQTPGKRRASIRVIKDSGRPLTPAESIGRNLMRIVDWLPSLYAVGIVSALVTKQNQRLGDLLVGSLVVRESSLAELRPSTWQSAETSANPSAAPLGASELSPEDISVIDAFLSRRSALEFDVRTRMAEEIFRRIKPKLTLPPGLTWSNERVLEVIAYERRATGRYT